MAFKISFHLTMVIKEAFEAVVFPTVFYQKEGKMIKPNHIALTG